MTVKLFVVSSTVCITGLDVETSTPVQGLGTAFSRSTPLSRDAFQLESSNVFDPSSAHQIVRSVSFNTASDRLKLHSLHQALSIQISPTF